MHAKNFLRRPGRTSSSTSSTLHFNAHLHGFPFFLDSFSKCVLFCFRIFAFCRDDASALCLRLKPYSFPHWMRIDTTKHTVLEDYVNGQCLRK